MTETALSDIIEQIGDDATLLQSQAANPASNVWVNASAGTGKTKVLTERVLRLLLPLEGQNDGTAPQNILCVTFTKAGANQMITRLMKTLSRWAVCSEQLLVKDLTLLLGHDPATNVIFKARKLFAMIIDLPGGLNVTTIHALCQSILGRFVVESGLPPNFSVMEASESKSLIKKARDGLVHDILMQKNNHPLFEDFTWLASIKNSLQINQILAAVLGDRKKLALFFDKNPDYKAVLRQYLNIDDNINEDLLVKKYLYDNFPEQNIKILANAFEFGGKKNKDNAITLFNYLHSDRQVLYQGYREVFYTTSGKCPPRKASHVSNEAKKQNPLAEGIFTAEIDRISEYEDKLNSLKIYRATCAILDIIYEITNRYQTLKNSQRKVDYDDLIHKTHALLTGPAKDWVLFKLDYGIDHILVDEAQDTSPDQWGILQALWDDFFTGQSVRSENGIERTVFVVGDNKQSIFSFQGANLNNFNSVHNKLRNQVSNAQKQWSDVPMNTSFRSTSAVIDFVDLVFEESDLRTSLTQDPELYRSHTAHRQGHSGHVELWPLYKAPKQDPLPPWTLPLQIRENHDANQALANRIAETIAAWIKNQDLLTSKNRPIIAGDIMILVRRRNALVDHLIRALKTHNVPVSGADRLVISDHIAVKDVLAALHFALLPDDDLTLATLLKSPLIGWTDDMVENHAFDRDGSLWQAVKDGASQDTSAWLSNLIVTMSGQNAFTAVSNILNYKAFNNNQSGWQSLVGRLGEDCVDPLEELLSIAQTFDANNPGSGLQGFLHYMQTNETEIKRELDSGVNKVRIMTVHASKGLESPIVFMPDTTSLPKAQTSDDGLIWMEDTIPLWSPTAQNDTLSVKTYKEIASKITLDEYYRLLYVAMTRAEDRLIVCGTLNNNETISRDKSWYNCALIGMNRINAVEKEWPHDPEFQTPDDEGKYLVFSTEQSVEPKPEKEKYKPNTISDLPHWVLQPLLKEQHPPRILKPSQDDSQPMPVHSPLYQHDNSFRYERGLLTHSLLQYLPELQQEIRKDAGLSYLNQQAPRIPSAVVNSILEESLAIINSKEFSMFFGEGSMSEVSVTGTVTNSNGKIDIISGQIDRMLIGDETIWIIDFKSNRPPPKDPKDVPPQYRKQLSAYKTLIQDIYPKHNIRCALLWTDGPFMTELDNL